IDVTRGMIEDLEAEISVQAEELSRLKAEYAALLARYPIPSPTERYGRIIKIAELAKELRSKRARLGWMKKRWIPELDSPILYQYATRGDSKNPYPYAGSSCSWPPPSS
ncbi:unnamed protein product, partial [marine sediment metagenome]